MRHRFLPSNRGLQKQATAIHRRTQEIKSEAVGMKLSKMERINLIHQHQMLLKLYPDEASFHEKAVEILRNGYEYLYDEVYQFVYDGDDAMTGDECKEVWDTLSMFESIDRTIEHLGLKHDSSKTTRFFGYDGNNEGKFLGFVEFTITKEGRFTYLPLETENYYNSHMPSRGIYNRMLEVWKGIDGSNRYPMTKEDLDRVLSAATHPSNR